MALPEAGKPLAGKYRYSIANATSRATFGRSAVIDPAVNFDDARSASERTSSKSTTGLTYSVFSSNLTSDIYLTNMNAVPAIQILPVPTEFLKNDQKTCDWKNKTYIELQEINKSKPQYEITEKTIYWLGAIDLSRIGERSKSFIQFVNEHWEFQYDSQSGNRVVNSEISSNRIEYDIAKLKVELLEAQKKSYKYANLLMKESIAMSVGVRRGVRTIQILRTPERIGVFSEKKWYNMPTRELIGGITNILKGEITGILVFEDSW